MSNLSTAEKCTMRDLANPELSVEFSTASKVMAEATAIINRLDQALMQVQHTNESLLVRINQAVNPNGENT